MRLLKKEQDALVALLEAGADGPAEMAADCAKTLDSARGDRNYWFTIVQHVVGFHVIGPFATSGQAEKAGAKHPAGEKVWIVPGYTAEGIDRLVREVDAPAKQAVDPIVAEDAALFRLGWKGKRADRDSYLKQLTA